eukprot:EG_transcript_25722
MSGIKVWRNAITKEQRAEFLKEIADCLDSGVAYDNNLLTEIPFGGRLAEMFKAVFAEIEHPEVGKFEDHDFGCFRVFVGGPPRITPTHYDPINTIVFSLNLIGHKKWYSKPCGLDVLWQTGPIYPNQVKDVTFWRDQIDEVHGGDILIMPEYIYHTVCYLETSITLDVECHPKPPKKDGFRLWRHIVPSLKAYAYKDSYLRWAGHFLLNFLSFWCMFLTPFATVRAIRDIKKRVGMATQGREIL